MKPNVVHPTFAYVGCFTSEKRKGHGKGISLYSIDPHTGSWSLVQVCETIQNPGFLALDESQKFLYAAHGSSSEVSAYAVEPQTGKLRMLNAQQTGGNNSPHLTIAPTNRHVIVANGPGLAAFPVKQDGSLEPASDIIVPPGEPGPYRHEQKGGAHPHQVLFDISGKFMVVPDKGIDKVLVYRLDGSSGKFVANDFPSVNARYGAAPRHAAIHPVQPYAYVVNELDSTVTAYHWNSDCGELRPFQVLPTTPTTYTGNNTGAEIAIAPSGNFVYASNRGHDSIVVFAVNQTGMLAPIGWEPTQGKKPRFFALDASGSKLYAANQDSDSIVVFTVDAHAGKLTPTGQVVETGTPTCIVFGHS